MGISPIYYHGELNLHDLVPEKQHMWELCDKFFFAQTPHTHTHTHTSKQTERQTNREI